MARTPKRDRRGRFVKAGRSTTRCRKPARSRARPRRRSTSSRRRRA